MQASPGSVSEQLNLGLRARSQGDHATALAWFEQAVSVNPKNNDARLELACALRSLSRLQEAEVVLRALLAEAPAHVRALVELGELLRDRACLSEAEEVLERALARAPRNIRVLMSLARLWRDRGDRVRSRSYLQTAATAAPEHAGVRLELAASLIDEGSFDEARQLLDGVIARDPSSVPALMRLGQLERRCGHRAAAAQAFRAALAQRPEHVQAMVEVAIEERAIGRPVESERILRQALDVDPDHLGALVQSAEHAWLAERDHQSLVFCRRGMAAHPHSLMPYLGASRAWASLGRIDKALAVLDEAATKTGEQPRIAARKVELLRQIGQWRQARLVLDQHSDAAKTNFSLWAQQVQLEIGMGAYGPAAISLEQPPSVSTIELSRANILRGHLAEALWHFEEAADRFKEALALNSHDAWTYAELARVNLMLLDVNAARTCLATSVKLDATRRLLRGQSLNSSQTYLGQIINEFLLDRATLELIATLKRDEPSQWLPALAESLQANPDSSAVAIGYLVALRQAGLIAATKPTPPVAAGTSPVIPQSIVQYWDTATLPRQVADAMSSWSEFNPGFGYVRFDDLRARDYLMSRVPDALPAYLRARHPAQKSDLFRLAYLLMDGGIYVDADDRCFAPLDTVLPPSASLVLYQEAYGTLGNNFMAAAPGNQLISHALERAIEAIMRNDGEVVWLSTGPGLITRTFSLHCGRAESPTAWLERVAVLDRGKLQSAVALHCMLHYKKAGKHWIGDAFGRSSRPVAVYRSRVNAWSEAGPAR